MLNDRSDQPDEVLDASPVGLARLDRDGRCRYADRVFRTRHGSPGADPAAREVDVMSLVTPARHGRALAGETVTFRVDAPSEAHGHPGSVVTLVPEMSDDGAVKGLMVFSVACPGADREARTEGSDGRGPEVARPESELAADDAEEWFKLAARAAGVDVWDWNLETGAFFADPEILERVGYGPGEIPLTAEAYFQIVHPDDRPVLETAIQGIIDGRLNELIYEHRKIHKNGMERWFLARGKVLANAAGRPARVVGTCVDITEYKETQLALAESEARYRRLVEVCTDPVLVHRNGTFLYGNPAAARFLGLKDQSDLCGLDVMKFVDPADHHLVVKRHKLMKSGVEKFDTAELRFVTADGTSRVGESSIGPIPWDGQIAALSMVRDITERRRMEDALRENEEFLRLVTDNTPTPISYVDTECRFRFVNQIFEKWFGTPRSEIIGQVAWDFTSKSLPTDQAEYARTQMKAAFQTALSGKNAEIDAMRVYSDGTRRYIRVSLVPHYGGHSSPIGICALTWDITELKRREQQLRDARDEAERANQSKSRFLAAASHDLRQPLQALNLLAYALSDRCRGDPERGILGDMKNALGAMESVLNGIIDISKLEAGVIEAEIGDVPLSGLFDRLRSSFELQAREQGLRLRFASTTLSVRSDPDLLARVLENLLANAIKYTPSGRILVGCRRRGGEVAITVCDTGAGIPSDKIDRVFEEFYQLDNAARNRTKGLGLGLAIVDRIARLLGHRIERRSTPGRGSTFAVIAPIAVGPFRPAPNPGAAASDSDFTKTSILVIEDDEQVLRATEQLLRDWGAEVGSAASIEQALDLVSRRGFRPDIIIADYSLPERETGPGAIQSLFCSMGRRIPAIIITGDTMPDRVREARDSGFYLLHKPINPGAFRDLIGRLIDGPADG